MTSFRVLGRADGEQGSVSSSGLSRAAALTRRLPPLFLWMVVLPGLAATFYFTFLASPMYISEAQFIVRAPQQIQPNGFNAVLQGVGLAPAQTDSFVVQDYIMSRDAIADLVAHHNLRDIMGHSGLDFLQGFPRPFEKSSLENLALAYPRFVRVDYNSSSGISTLQVRAFRPQDAQATAAALLDGGEVLVNHLNDRADHDAIADTRRQIAEAESELGVAEQNLTAFRNRQRLIDPTRSSMVNLELLGKLQGDIATLRAERAGIAASAPQSPELPLLDSRIRAYEAQAESQQSQMAGQTGSLAPMIGEYERLTLERDFADKTLASAATAAEQARQEALRKRLYLERISNPNLPDSATEPHRVASLATVLMTLLLVWGAVALIMAGLREHQQH